MKGYDPGLLLLATIEIAQVAIIKKMQTVFCNVNEVAVLSGAPGSLLLRIYLTYPSVWVHSSFRIFVFSSAVSCSHGNHLALRLLPEIQHIIPDILFNILLDNLKMRSMLHSVVKENSWNHTDFCGSLGCVAVRKLSNFCEPCFPHL